MRHSFSDLQPEQLAMATHGFVGADLAALCCEAAFVCLRQHLNQRSSSSNLPLEGTPISASDSSTNVTDVSSDSASSCITVSPTTLEARCSFSLIAESGNSRSQQMLSKEGEHTLGIGFEDFEKEKIKTKPSAMQEVLPFYFIS